MCKSRNIVLMAIAVLASAACAGNYVTPGAGLSMAEIADNDLQSYYQNQPASPFPANMAILRVQDAGYVTKTGRGHGHGRFTVVTTRDVESDQAVDRIRGLPLVGGVAPVGRLLLPSAANTIRDLRAPAASLRADLLLIYSIDTSFTVDGRSLGPLSLISLGLIPNLRAHVTATVAGALVDVRTGFIYGTTEATAREDQRASIWSTDVAIESSRLRVEKEAFDSFVDEFQGLWGSVLNVHAATRPPVPMQLAERNQYYRIEFELR